MLALSVIGAASVVYYLLFIRISTRWHQEAVTSSTVSMDSDHLKVLEHAWKIIEADDKSCKWGFKCTIEFPVLEEDVGSESEPWKDAPIVMGIKELTYRLFDKDGFELDSITTPYGKQMEILEGSIETFQLSNTCAISVAANAAYGKLNIVTEYARGSLEGLMRIKQPEGTPPVPERKAVKSLDVDYLDELAKDPKTAQPEAPHASTPRFKILPPSDGNSQ